MKLFAVTITGIGKDNDISELIGLSKMYPWLEWGVLLSETRMGKYPRYPSKEFIAQLTDTVMSPTVYRATPNIRLAAHLCGKTAQSFLNTISPAHESDEWCKPFGMTNGDMNRLFGRMQINFNATRTKISPSGMKRLYHGWCEGFDGSFITQHNIGNDWIWKTVQDLAMQYPYANPHQVLHDSSGGNGVLSSTWEKPIAGVLNGYAGGINPNNVISVLTKLDEVVGDGYIWIDMESGVRDGNDRMNMPAIHSMLYQIATIGAEWDWF